MTSKTRIGTLLFIALALVFSALPGMFPSAAEDINPLLYQSRLISTGSDEGQLLFTWRTGQATGRLAIKERNESKYTEIEASSDDLGDIHVHKATVDGLRPSTTYEYRLLGENNTASAVYTVSTGNPQNFSFFAAGDPQIGATNVVSDAEGWKKTLSTAVTNFPSASFLISMGDQVQTADNISHYTGYLSPPELSGLPTAVAVGNHDSGSRLFPDHHSFPNMTRVGPGTTAVNYWFRYGSTLFMFIDSNTRDMPAHRDFMEKAIAANSGATWRIVAYHHSSYSEAFHYYDSDRDDSRRFNPTSMLDELGIDVVFSGHDHSYTRTYHMKDNAPVKSQQRLDADGNVRFDDTGLLYNNVVDPAGTLYITLNSSSGSKYYTWNHGEPAFFSAARHQFNAPEFSVIDMTTDSFTITTYRADTMAALDTYTIRKRRSVDADEVEKALNAYVPDPRYVDDPFIIVTIVEAIEGRRGRNGGIGACLVNEATGEIVERGHNEQFEPYFRSRLHAEKTLLDRY